MLGKDKLLFWFVSELSIFELFKLFEVVNRLLLKLLISGKTFKLSFSTVKLTKFNLSVIKSSFTPNASFNWL